MPHHPHRPARRWHAALLALAMITCTAPALAAIPATERQVLIDLYNGTAGDGWRDRTGWKTAGTFSAPGTECAWEGVTCDAGGNHVTELSLSDNDLVGTLPPTLNRLTALTHFDAGLNALTGTIPELEGLAALDYFLVDSNALSGPIPSLATLRALQTFSVRDNQLTGPLPALTGLTELRVFIAYRNQLSGPIPSLGGLTKLEVFGVADNQLSGPLPSFSGLTALRRVDASNNQLSGTIPNLDGLPALLFFLVDHNQLSGTPPPTPASLLDTGSMLCPNLLHAPSPSDTLWNNATAGATWFADCTRGYLVTASATAGGSISPSQGVADGGTATFAITPQAGQEVDSVISACGGTRTGNSFTTDPVRADCSLTVSFRAAAVPVPTLGQWALMVLGLLLAGLGARRVRQRGA